jgi:N-glycosylase/DNA lyase
MTEDDLWRELVACILGSRVRFEVAHSAVERIEKRRLFCQERRSSRFDHYERDVSNALSGRTLTEDGADAQNRYPFFRIRANQIRRAAERFYGSRGSVRGFLDAARDIRETRRLLVSEVPGLGPKQASLFLRNIGYVTNIAVLDVHVLTYMSWVGLTDTLVKSVATIRKYETLEDSFIEHSYSFGYTPDRFDLAVWVVVKVAKEEYKSWG